MARRIVKRGSVSLFSGAGCADLAIRYGANIRVVTCCEINPTRAGIIRKLIPDADVINGDITTSVDRIVQSARTGMRECPDYYEETPDEEEETYDAPLLVTVSAPCQSMSLINHRKRNPERNHLILPALEIVRTLEPEYVIIENVPMMQRTSISHDNTEATIPEHVRRALGDAYDIRSEVVSASAYGVPQLRKRLITVCVRRDGPPEEPVPFPEPVPAPTTLRQAIAHLPPLDAVDYEHAHDPKDVLHNVPVWPEHYHWFMRHTPEGKSAYDNDACLACARTGIPRGLAHCPDCEALLPRPTCYAWSCDACDASVDFHQKTCRVCKAARPEGYEATKHMRIIRGFGSTYARLKYDAPANCVTTTSASLHTLRTCHPEQHRVLSVREVLILGTLLSHPGYDAPWSDRVETVMREYAPWTVREVVGECIPPKVMAAFVEALVRVTQ